MNIMTIKYYNLKFYKTGGKLTNPFILKLEGTFSKRIQGRKLVKLQKQVFLNYIAQ